MSIRASHHDYFEGDLEMVNCRIVKQYSHEEKLVRVGVGDREMK
jgi:hypothetical protein